jgi:hypothetical protein
MFIPRITVAAASLAVLVGCVGGIDSGPDISEFATACMFEVDPPGAYVWSSGDTEVKPGGDGTAAGAAAVNACIRTKAAADGVDLTAAAAPRRASTTEVETAGGMVTETFTYGTPPAAAQSTAQPAVEGNCRRRSVLSGGSGYFGCIN